MSALLRTAAVTFLIVIASTGVASAHEGHGELAMWNACDDLALDTACSFENAAHDIYRGTCRAVSGDLICVRNRPIERASTTASSDRPWTALTGLASAGLLALAVFAFPKIRTKREEHSK